MLQHIEIIQKLKYYLNYIVCTIFCTRLSSIMHVIKNVTNTKLAHMKCYTFDQTSRYKYFLIHDMYNIPLKYCQFKNVIISYPEHQLALFAAVFTFLTPHSVHTLLLFFFLLNLIQQLFYFSTCISYLLSVIF